MHSHRSGRSRNPLPQFPRDRCTARLETSAVPTEIAPLVHSFNRVLERLELGYRTQQEFLARRRMS